MRINTNITALNTFNSYTSANNKISNSVAKLSSGYAINNAADNAAGLAISEKMRAQVRGLDRASANSQDAISLIQTAEGNLKSSDEILQRMREISVQSSSDVNENNIDREALQAEFSQLQAELDEIAEDASFNNQKLLNGNLSSSKTTTSIATSAKGVTVSSGNANAGKYDFKVSVKTTTAPVAAEKPSNAKSSVATSSLNSDFFDAATVSMGADVEASSLLNGNYELSAKANYSDDGNSISSVTFYAKGDNGQNFEVTKTADDLKGIADDGTLAIDFGSKNFQVSLTASRELTSTDAASKSELEALAGGIKGTVTVGGGLDEVKEETAVYASLTGAADVKLDAGMSSVTFDNGVSVKFEKLTAADLDTTAKAGAAGGMLAAADNDISWSTTTAGTSTFTVDAKGLFSTYSGTATVAAGTTFSLTVGNQKVEYTTTDAAGETQDSIIAKLTADTDDITVQGVDFAATSTAGTITFTSAAGDQSAKTAASVTSSGVGDVTYNNEKIFGDSADTSTITVASKKNDGLTIQVGANTGDEMEINLERADAEYLGVKGLNVGTQDGASKAIDVVNKAINQVTSQRAYLGAMQNRLDYKIANLETSSQNLTSAESAIRDVDMAAEMTKFTNSNILSQASTAMLAQANTLPQNVLSLLG